VEVVYVFTLPGRKEVANCVKAKELDKRPNEEDERNQERQKQEETFMWCPPTCPKLYFKVMPQKAIALERIACSTGHLLGHNPYRLFSLLSPSYPS